MARFYGLVHGNRGAATRLGSVHSGMTTWAAGHDGAVRVWLYTRNDVNYAHVSFEPWHCRGERIVIYDGPLSPYRMTKHTRWRLDRPVIQQEHHHGHDGAVRVVMKGRR